MRGSWQECACFPKTSQRLADKIRTIKKGRFSKLEILVIHKKTHNEQDSHTISDAQNKNSLTEMNR